MKYKDKQQKYGESLINQGFFGNDKGGGIFRKKKRPFVLQDGQNNLFPDIRSDVTSYIKQNKISMWSGTAPTGHILSSQIACFNHLFPIRNDKSAVLDLLNSANNDFVDVFPIPENTEGYIQFEAVGGEENFLNERTNSRGLCCTSVDALIHAKHKDGRKFLIPIEWKYTEAYYNSNISNDTRIKRYSDLIEKSKYLNKETFNCCWYEPFYQLMRQTLWAEQLLIHNVPGYEADDYLHLHIIPDNNVELLSKKYKCSNKNLEETWTSCLTEPDKYVVLSPKELWGNQQKDTPIYKYLEQRYWQ